MGIDPNIIPVNENVAASGVPRIFPRGGRTSKLVYHNSLYIGRIRKIRADLNDSEQGASNEPMSTKKSKNFFSANIFTFTNNSSFPGQNPISKKFAIHVLQLRKG